MKNKQSEKTENNSKDKIIVFDDSQEKFLNGYKYIMHKKYKNNKAKRA